MKYRNKEHGRYRPQCIDSDFADALEHGSRSEQPGRDRCDHRTLALCRQVQRALSLALAGECNDDTLRDAYIVDVLPAPGPKRLTVRVVVGQAIGITEFLQRIERVAPRLRASVAQAITRKRVPELVFIPAAPEEAQHD